MDTLVLNSSYMPINRVSSLVAIGDLLTGRAEVVEAYENRIVRASHYEGELPRTFDALLTDEPFQWKVPSIIRFLGRAVFVTRQVRFNRHNVWLRDKGRCQYCMRMTKLDDFTYDHVIPFSRGGKTCWENIVVACIPCNHTKANRTPQEAKMHILRKPYRPEHLPGQVSPALKWHEGMPHSWQSFLASMSYWHGNLD